MNIKEILLTAGVIAAFISAIMNLITTILNNRTLKTLEREKRSNEIDSYRYSMLYKLIKNWHSYDTEFKGNTAAEISTNRLLNLFMDDLGRYQIAKPLLDQSYIEILENKKKEGEKRLLELVEAENDDGSHTKEFPEIQEKYFKCGSEFSSLLKQTINDQMKTLLSK